MDVSEAFFGVDVISRQSSHDSSEDTDAADELKEIMNIEAIWKDLPSDQEMVLPSVQNFAAKHNHQQSQSTHLHKIHQQQHLAENLTQKAESIHHHHDHHPHSQSAVETEVNTERIETNDPNSENSANISSGSFDLDNKIFEAQSASIAQTETVLEMYGLDEENPNDSPTKGGIGAATGSAVLQKSPNITHPVKTELEPQVKEEESFSPTNSDKSNPLGGSDDSFADRIIPLRKFEENLEQAKLESKTKEKTKSVPRLSTVQVHRDESPTENMILRSSNSSPSLSKQNRITTAAPNLNFIPLMALGDLLKNKTPPQSKPNSPSVSGNNSRSMSPANNSSRKSPTQSNSASRTTSPSTTRGSSSSLLFTAAGRARPVSPAILKTPMMITSASLSSATISAKPQRPSFASRAISPLATRLSHVNMSSVQSAVTASSTGTTSKEGLSISSLSSSGSHASLPVLALKDEDLLEIPNPKRNLEAETMKSKSTAATTTVNTATGIKNTATDNLNQKKQRKSVSVSNTAPPKNGRNCTTGNVPPPPPKATTAPTRRNSANSMISVSKSASSEDMWPANGRIRHVTPTTASAGSVNIPTSSSVSTSTKISPSKKQKVISPNSRPTWK